MRKEILQRQQTRKRDRSLIKMLFVQVTLLIHLAYPHATLKVYSSFASSPSPQSLEMAIQTLLLNLFTLFTCIASGMPFCIYTLAGGSIYRNVLFDLVKYTIDV
jgi:ABC-type spermidine/putrescine transport system permease subunit I